MPQAVFEDSLGVSATDSRSTARTLSDTNAARLVWAFLALGVVARLVRYLLRFPIWEDEGFLCANLLDRGYAELARPLDYCQVAPILYLWVQRTFVDLLGFNEYGLRAFSFVCGVSSLFLFRHVAGRLWSGWPLVLSVGLFSVSYPLIRYSAEAKPYGSDMLIGLMLLALVVEWLRDPGKTRWLWALAALAPLALGLSYPAVFAAGGASVAVGYTLLTDRGSRGWTPWVAFNLAVAGTFLAVLLIAMGNQSAESVQFMQSFWSGCFPPKEIARLPGWLLSTHTGEMLAYPVGSKGGGSTLTFLGILAGLAALARTGTSGKAPWADTKRGALFFLACAPLALNLLAAAIGRYPYGGQTRLVMYHAAMFCLLDGLGWGTILAWRLPAWLLAWRKVDTASCRAQEWRAFRDPRQLVGAALLVVVALGIMLRDFSKPTKAWSDLRARDFARWFWVEMPHQGEVVCVHTDLYQEFSPLIRTQLSWVVTYLCNQRIYSPRHARGEPADESRVSRDRPLVCVLYSPFDPPLDKALVAHWLATMNERYDLVGHERFPATRYGRQETLLICTDYVEMFRFVPKGSTLSSDGAPLELTRLPGESQK